MIKKLHLRTKHAAIAASLTAALGIAPMAAQACGDQAYIGTICYTAANYCPSGYLQASGQVLQIAQHQALFSLVGSVYGGNGSTTFALPDLQGRFPVGTGQGQGLPLVVRGQKDGVPSTSVTLTAAQLPQHTHSATFVPTTSGSGPITASGSVSVPLSGSVSNASVSGTVTVNALTTATTGAQNSPSTSGAVTVGRPGGANQFYPYDSTKAVAVPTTTSLTATGGTLSGNASGAVSLPVGGSLMTGGTVTVGTTPAAPAQPVAVPTVPPRLGLTACIVELGIWPTQP